MARTISYTYQVVTPESAEHGDVAEHGFMLPYGWRFDIDAPEVAKDLEENPQLYWRPARGLVKEAVGIALNYGCVEDTGDGTFYSVDPDIDYATGEDTTYAVHFNGFTRRELDIISRAIVS